MILELTTTPRLVSAGQWRKLSDGSYRCGNVMVRNIGKTGLRSEDWRIFVRDGTGRTWQWVECHPKNRPWGYGHHGQAKIGAALMAKHQRRVTT